MLQSGRILALDYGRVHTGAAISDPTGNVVRPLVSIREAGSPAGLEKVASLAEYENAVAVIVGMPVSLSGELGLQAKETEAFIADLRRTLRLPVVTWDERFTSKVATRKGRYSGASRHSLAACCLLEDYLGSEAYRRGSGRV